MVFSSLTFICIFLPAVFVLYYILRGDGVRNVLLVVASLVFYAFGEPVYIILMLASITVNYFLGVLLDRTGRRKAVLALAVILNLGALAVFKYAGWFVSTIASLAGVDIPVPELALPIGISFYTFQALSYLIDVYRRQVKHQKNPVYFCLYISFFPQLIAGPIVKYHDIEKQIAKRTYDPDAVAAGFRRFIRGLAKKVIIANTMALAVDTIFAYDPAQINAASAWTAAIAYALQIFFDFSGYSDMAIGMGRMFGFRFLENFDYPYTAGSMKEFWRKWHISLSTWFREYLYIPLGGNRKGKLRTCLNKLIVFFCTGLWHGANWTFVLWGMIHGGFLLMEDAVPVKKMPAALRHVYTMLVVVVTFVIFRADTITDAGNMISKMFTGFNGSGISGILAAEVFSPFFIFILVIAVILCMPVYPKLFAKTDIGLAAGCGTAVSSRLTVAANILSVLLLVYCILMLSGGGYNPFIYFRF